MRIPTFSRMVKMGFPAPCAKLLRAELEQHSDMHNIGHNRILDILNKCNRIMDANGMMSHGAEYIPAGSNKRSPAIYYVNRGDTYDTTLMYVNGAFSIGNWGSIVELGNYA